MKKIILLLTVLTLGVIACDKNELGMDMDGSSINPIEATVEASADINEEMILDLLARLDDVKFPKSTATHYTSKDISDYLHVATGIYDGKWYEFIFSDDNAACNIPAEFTTFYLSSGTVEGTTDVQFTLTGDVQLTISLDLAPYLSGEVVFGVQLTEAGVITSGTVDGLEISF